MHTPGPWEAHDTSGTEPTVCRDMGNGECSPLCTFEWGDENSTADACLMAAAPDLYEACKEALKQFENVKDEFSNDGDGYFDTWQSTEAEIVLENVKKAIAKAEGRQ